MQHLPCMNESAMPLSPSTDTSQTTRRISCAACLRPRITCICQWITPVANEVEVLILQHPAEVHQAKGSARLLHLSLRSNCLVIGETFEEKQLHMLMHGPADNPAHAVLLYPPTPGMFASHVFEPDALVKPQRLRLIVLDATWRKSLKMLHCNPLLQALPRVLLDEAPPSAYRIRKTRHAHQLSTLEAACHALAQLERNAHRYRPLLAGFDGFVMQQLTYRNLRAN